MNWLKASVSGGVGFVIAIVVALCIEHFGGAIGGIISSVPTTIVPTSYVFLTESGRTNQEQSESLYAAPIGIFATNLFFLPVWKMLPQYLEKRMKNDRLTFLTLVVSLVLWFLAALSMTLLQEVVNEKGIQIFSFSILVMLVCVVMGVLLCWRLPPTPKGTNKVKWYIHCLRGLAATMCIFISSWLSSSGMGLFAGAFSGFPAIFSTSIVSVSLSQGASVSTGAVGPMIIGGCAGGWYALICGWFHLHSSLPVIDCILIAYVICVCCWNIPVYFFIRWRRDKTALSLNLRSTIHTISFENEKSEKPKVLNNHEEMKNEVIYASSLE